MSDEVNQGMQVTEIPYGHSDKKKKKKYIHECFTY